MNQNLYVHSNTNKQYTSGKKNEGISVFATNGVETPTAASVLVAPFLLVLPIFSSFPFTAGSHDVISCMHLLQRSHGRVQASGPAGVLQILYQLFI